MLWPYAMKAFEEQLNVIKLNDDEIIAMKKFAGTTTDIYPKNHHTWGCLVHVLDAILQGNISGLTKWEPTSRAGSYLGN